MSSVAETRGPDSPEFWIAWHALGLGIVIAAPLYYRWGQSVHDVSPEWIPQIVVMGMAYLALATVVAVVRPRRTLRALAGLVTAGIAIYGIAYLLLTARPDIQISRLMVAFASALAVSLVVLPILLQTRRWFGFLFQALLILSLTSPWDLLNSSDRIPLQVVLGTRSLSKLPFVIAMDQGLYEKHGLDVELWMPLPEFSGGAITHPIRPTRPDILVDGQTPIIFRIATEAGFPTRIAVAGVDCVVRTHIIGRPGMDALADLRGKRLGINLQRATTGFVARLLAQRMGWDRLADISIMEQGRDIEALRDGLVDAIVANERTFALLMGEEFPILADTSEWNEPIAGNSVLVEPAWLEEEPNRDAARRFLMATAEGLAVFHQQPEVALRVLSEWHGISDRQVAETIYSRGAFLSRKPYPCHEGISKTMELYDSNEMRRYAPEDFFDDSLVRELDESGFLDSLYK